MFYKYLPPERFDVLENGMVRFSQPRGLNDPFELAPKFQGLGTTEGIQNIASQDQISAARAEGQNLLRIEGAEDLLRDMRTSSESQLSERVLAFWNATLGILSLSKTRESLTMWAHYACSHTGFVVGFDESHPYFSTDAPKDGQEFGYVRPVEYGKQRPTGSVASLTGIEVFLRKSPEWKCEEEWRLIRPLAERSKVDPRDPFHIYLFEFPRESVVEVVLGCRAGEKLVNDVQRILDSGDLPRAKLSRAQVADDSYSLAFV